MLPDCDSVFLFLCTRNRRHGAAEARGPSNRIFFYWAAIPAIPANSGLSYQCFAAALSSASAFAINSLPHRQ